MMNSLSEEYSTSNVVPEIGQLVEVRRRQWVVTDVKGSSLRDGDIQHLIAMTSLDEDALGEELQIIWQIEPGAKVVEKAGLPCITGFDDHDRIEAFLDAVRWGAVTNADRGFLQSPFRSGITIEDYQLEPLVRAIDMARVNLLIADDVGLGKTIEAGLIVQELLVRHRARTVLIVCPSSLQMKWQMEMHEKFGLDFRIVDTEYIKELRRKRGLHANPWSSFPRLITSMDWMKDGEAMRLLRDVLPTHPKLPRAFDILIVDEAHNVSPSTTGKYALESLRTRMMRTLVPHFEHRIFLSATPHNGYQESFTSLLEMLDDQRFSRTIEPDEKQLAKVMVRRLKSDLVDAEGKKIYPERILEALEVDYDEQELKIHALLGEFVKDRQNSVKGSKREFAEGFIHKILKKRLFSSPMAFSTTLQKYREGLANPTRKTKTSKFEDGILKKAIARQEDDYADDGSKEEAIGDAVDAAAMVTVDLTDGQRKMLETLSNWAERNKRGVDSKARALLDWLDCRLKNDKGEWNDKRVILFTEYLATHGWLQEILANHGYGGDRLMTLHGGMPQEDREKVKAAFQADPLSSSVRILLATDAASEGIDLQNYCNYLIHVEIPWNPNVMEQRNGRIDRHGQKASTVHIWHPVRKGFVNGDIDDIDTHRKNGDLEYLMLAAKKVHAIREDLGSVGPVLERQIEEILLGKRERVDTRVAEGKAKEARKQVVADRQLKEKIAKLHDRVLETKRDFHLSPERIEHAVRTAMALADLPALELVKNQPATFHVPALPGSWRNVAEGLNHPYTGVRRPITFDHDVAKGRDDIVLVHLNHRLVQMSLRLLREEIWKPEELKNLHRVTVKTIDDANVQEPIVLVWSRLVIIGDDRHRLHEEITLSGGEMKATGYARIDRIGELERLMEASVSLKSDEKLLEKLQERFQRDEDAVMKSVDARSKDRLKYLQNTLTRRMNKEQEDISSILEELERNIRKELNQDGKPEQLSMEAMLYGEEEKQQIQKDIDALKMRLERIPQEREREREAIEQRYSNLSDRTFPVAVTFIVPESFVRSPR